MIAATAPQAGPRAETHTRYRADIDGLRAIAILTVVAFHAGLPGTSGGFVGVDVFFVISGFLITSMLVDEAQATGHVALLRFYGRRMRRLMPSFLLVLFAVLVAGLWLDPAPALREPQDLARSALAALTVRANHYFLDRTGTYFGAQGEAFPLLHTWSLSVEEQFYLVWPLGVLLIRRFSSARWFRWSALVSLILVLVASFGRNAWLVAHDDAPRAFYLMPARAWELALGGVLCHLRTLRGHPRVGDALSVLGLIGIAIAVVGFDRTTPFPGWAALVPTVGTALVILGNQLAPRGASARLLSTAPFVGVGLISYSLYLWHWPMLVFANVYWGPGSTVLRDGSVALAAIALSALTYRYVEMPFRRHIALKAPPMFVVATGLAGIAAVSVSAGAVGFWGARHAYPSALSAATEDHPGKREACFVGLNDARLPLESCTHVPSTNGRVLVVWGDSHAEAWLPLAEAAVEGPSSGAGLVQLTKAGCPPLLDLAPRMFGRPYDPSCRDFNANVVEELKRRRAAGEEVGVLLVARWSGYLGTRHTSAGDFGVNVFDATAQTPEESVQKLREGLGRTLDALQSAGVRTLVLLPAPEMRYSSPQCLLRWGWSDAACGIARDLYRQQRAPAVEAIAEVAGSRSGVRVLDPEAYFCTPECDARKGATILFYDDDHVSASAARGLAPFASRDLAWVTGG